MTTKITLQNTKTGFTLKNVQSGVFYKVIEPGLFNYGEIIICTLATNFQVTLCKIYPQVATFTIDANNNYRDELEPIKSIELKIGE